MAFDSKDKLRLSGLDIARFCALLGMVAVNYFWVMKISATATPWVIRFIEGKAAASFVTIAGLGIALMAKKHNDGLKRILAKRALFLFIGGLVFYTVWDADILHFYAVYIAFAIFLLGSSWRMILLCIFAILLISNAMLLLLDFDRGWDWKSLAYQDFWTLSGFLRHTFYNGFHPFFPWVSFLLWGMLLGRLDLREQKLLVRLLVFSLFALLMMTILNYFARLFDGDWRLLLSASPIPSSPVYVVTGAATATALVSLCLLSAQFCDKTAVWNFFALSGRMSLSFYYMHVLIGMGLLEAGGLLFNQNLSIIALATGGFIFFILCFTAIWSRFFKLGPMEYLMRSLCS